MFALCHLAASRLASRASMLHANMLLLYQVFQVWGERTVRTSRTGAFGHDQDLRLLLAGVSAQETLVLVVLIVGAAHRGVVVVALWTEEQKPAGNRWVQQAEAPKNKEWNQLHSAQCSCGSGSTPSHSHHFRKQIGDGSACWDIRLQTVHILTATSASQGK